MTSSDTVDFPFLRRIRVEFSGPTHGDGGQSYESDGTQNTLRIRAQIRKASFIAGDPTVINIWNLSRDTRNSMQRSGKNGESGTKIRIFAGWDYGSQGELAQCFWGDYFNSTSVRRGPDIVTTIYAISAMESLSKTDASVSWDKDTLVSEAVREVASMLPGVTVDPKLIIGLDTPLGTQWPEADSVANILERLKMAYAFRWSINDNVFTAVKNGSDGVNVATLGQPNLIDANAVLSGVQQYERMIQWRCTFNPSIGPLTWITINSTVLKDSLNGKYQVLELEHLLDATQDSGFISFGYCLLPFGAGL